MHTRLIEEATHEELKKFAYYIFKEIEQMPEVYEEAEEELYEEIYGPHFNEYTLHKALDKLKNEDGTSGPHWTLEQTNEVARINGITKNLYDWCYVMNMIYSDYYGAVSNDLSYYVKLAKKFIEDKDAKDGKPYRYYKAMREA